MAFAENDVLNADLIEGMTGLETMQAIVEGKLPRGPIAVSMGIRLVSAAKGQAVFDGAPSKDFCNPLGSVHGGWYGAILDSALGCAVHTEMPVGGIYTTLEYKINITRAIPLGMRVRATANTQHVGRSTAVAEARLVGVEDGRLYATGSTTCIILSR